jgi:hypothetical protein
VHEPAYGHLGRGVASTVPHHALTHSWRRRPRLGCHDAQSTGKRPLVPVQGETTPVGKSWEVNDGTGPPPRRPNPKQGLSGANRTRNEADPAAVGLPQPHSGSVLQAVQRLASRPPRCLAGASGMRAQVRPLPSAGLRQHRCVGGTPHTQGLTSAQRWRSLLSQAYGSALRCGQALSAPIRTCVYKHALRDRPLRWLRRHDHRARRRRFRTILAVEWEPYAAWSWRELHESASGDLR